MLKSSHQNNNFNIIRLLAALEVMLYHGFNHFHFDSAYIEPIKEVLIFIPGVPVFFFISGFLIFKSFESNRGNLKKYFKNRFLRIYPALWVCFLFTVFLLAISNVITPSLVLKGKFWVWVLAQLSIFQSFKLPEFGSWGLGHPNGSLWSICVELQFYFFIPIFFLFFNRFLKTRNSKTILIILLMGVSVAYNSYITNYCEPDSELTKGLALFLPFYFYFFGMGILFHLHFDRLKKWVINKFYIWGILYLIYYLIFSYKLALMESVYDSTIYGIIGLIILAFATFSLAYSFQGLSYKIIGNSDISYGVYIYHMPIFNYFYEQQNHISIVKLMFFCLLTIAISYISWIGIERVALSKK